MRLWHIDLIPYLPKSQLIAQWRELNSIFKKQDKHILINYVYNYSKEYLLNYSCEVINQLYTMNYKLNMINFNDYFGETALTHWLDIEGLTFAEHDEEYLTICYWNLKEKYLRGQKDFDYYTWVKLNNYYKGVLNESLQNILFME